MNILKRLSPLHKKIIMVIFVGLVWYGSVFYIVHIQTNNLRQTLEIQVEEQIKTLETVARSTAKNGVDVNTKQIIQDCSVEERQSFDVLLGNLNVGLSMQELNTLDRLFGRCGAFFAEQRLIMTARLEREVEIFERYISQLETLSAGSKKEDYKLDTWKQLVVEEQKQSEIFMQLVILQDSIIRTLREGRSADSEEIKAILGEVSEAQGVLIVTNKQAAAIREQLISS